MYQLVGHFFELVFGAKSQEVNEKFDKLSTVSKAYYQKQPSAIFNSTMKRRAGWVILLTGAVLLQPLVLNPVGVTIIALTIFSAAVLIGLAAILRDKSAYYAFERENKKEKLTIITKAYMYEDVGKKIKSALEVSETNKKSSRYQVLATLLKKLEISPSSIFIEDLFSDAISAKRYVEKVWLLTQLLAEESDQKGIVIKDFIPEDYPGREKIISLIQGLDPAQQRFLIEGNFSADSLLSQQSGLSQQDLQTLESLVKNREDGAIGTIKNMGKLIFFDEEALSIDNQIMEQTLDNLREKVEAFLQSSQPLTSVQERVKFMVGVEERKDRLDDNRQELIERVLTLHCIKKSECSNEDILMKNYLYEQILENEALSEKIEEMKVDTQAIDLDVERKLAFLEKQQTISQVPKAFVQDIMRKSVYTKQKGAIKVYIDKVKSSRKVPPNVQKLLRGIQAAYEEKDSEACEKILRESDLYEGFALDSRAGKHIRTKYVPEINDKWQDFCQQLQSVQTENRTIIPSIIQAVENFLDVYDKMKENESKLGGMVFMINKGEIKEGIRKNIAEAVQKVATSNQLRDEGDQGIGDINLVSKYDDLAFDKLAQEYRGKGWEPKLSQVKVDMTQKHESIVTRYDETHMQSSKVSHDTAEKSGIARKKHL